MRITVLGLQGSGKTYLVRHCIIPARKNHLVFDVMGEYTGFERYVPKFADDRDRLKEETALFIRKLIIPNVCPIENPKPKKKECLNLVVFDEADLYAPATERIAPGLRNLVVKSRHYGLDIVFVTRRPTDISAYLMDTSDYLIVGKQVGQNALRIIGNINTEAREAVQELDYENHEFIILDRERKMQKIHVNKDCKKIPDILNFI